MDLLFWRNENGLALLAQIKRGVNTCFGAEYK